MKESRMEVVPWESGRHGVVCFGVLLGRSVGGAAPQSGAKWVYMMHWEAKPLWMDRGLDPACSVQKAQPLAPG